MAKVGRPTKYDPIYPERIVQFFSPPHFIYKDMTITKSDGTQIDKTVIEPCPPLFLSDFARSIGIKMGYSQTFSRWAKKYKKFSDALKEAKELENERYRVNGSMGLYSAAFSIFTLKNIAGWRDKTEIQGLPTSPQINIFVQNIIHKAGISESKRPVNPSNSEGRAGLN